MAVDKGLVGGSTVLMLLSLLAEKDCYGYEIIKAIATYSDGQYELKEPSLYTSLKRLESQKLIQSYWGDESKGGRRKYYRLTPLGRQTYEHAVAQWDMAKQLIDKMIKRSEASG